jgi:hypothetical protein
VSALAELDTQVNGKAFCSVTSPSLYSDQLSNFFSPVRTFDESWVLFELVVGPVFLGFEAFHPSFPNCSGDVAASDFETIARILHSFKLTSAIAASNNAQLSEFGRPRIMVYDLLTN